MQPKVALAHGQKLVLVRYSMGTDYVTTKKKKKTKGKKRRKAIL